MSCSLANTPLIRLIDYLDEKLKKWWETPEVTNALLTDRMYHLTHLELVRTGSLMMTKETSSTAQIQYKTDTINIFDYYRDQYDIELQHPEMPLFICDDGEPAMYPAEVITMEIVRPLKSDGRHFLPLLTFLERQIGKSWSNEPDLVKNQLKNIDFHLSSSQESQFGSLKLSSKLPYDTMSFETGNMVYCDWFEKFHNYTILNTTIPLITISLNKMDMRKFQWPAELISIVLY
uniref:PAZ domain-containing protein n=1 Tax=Caenorhabditis japonica TaxID=281687 RepID=A0A8R1DHY3_CAEJA